MNVLDPISRKPGPAWQTLLTYLFALIWLINGLFCKVLLLVPRHAQIVERILGDSNVITITRLIGIAEIGMAIWIITGKFQRLCAITQIILIAIMNIIEFLMADDLLLFGKANLLLSLLLISAIYFNEWITKQQPSPPPEQ